ncbi:hypothetical protein ACP70R_047495 [Stipagrostis hirtigluma subsp. patula]
MALPDDVLAGVLRRLPPSALAAARCVCKDWRAAVDARRLLRADLLLPRSVRGVSASLHLLPGPGPDADADASRRFATVVDHCSGLLLYRDPRGLHVANPATRTVARRRPGGGAQEAGPRRTAARARRRRAGGRAAADGGARRGRAAADGGACGRGGAGEAAARPPRSSAAPTAPPPLRRLLLRREDRRHRPLHARPPLPHRAAAGARAGDAALRRAGCRCCRRHWWAPIVLTVLPASLWE